MVVELLSDYDLRRRLALEFGIERGKNQAGVYQVVDTPLETVLRDFETVVDPDEVVSDLAKSPLPQFADIGCGTGRSLVELQVQVGGRGFGLDAALHNVLRNRTVQVVVNTDDHITATSKNGTLIFYASDMHYASEKLSNVDLVYSRYAIQYSSLQLRVLDQVCRTLAPRGRALLADFMNTFAITPSNAKLELPACCVELENRNPGWSFMYAEPRRVRYSGAVVVHAGSQPYQSPFEFGQRGSQLVSVITERDVKSRVTYKHVLAGSDD